MTRQTGDAFFATEPTLNQFSLPLLRALEKEIADRNMEHFSAKSPSKIEYDTCYPEFREFLEHKRKLDPQELFQSDWYRHYRSEEA